MEVTRANFQEILEELDPLLKEATFLGIDGEFTGLNSGPDAKPFDTPTQYYSKLRSGSMDFLMVQFGLSVFTHNSQTNRYCQRSYNFYVFPRPLNRNAPDCRFMCQSSSISFLASRGFDFNKLFNSGIPYLTMMEEEKLSKKFEERQRIREEGLELIPISDEDKPQIDEICTRINEFLSSDAEELSIDRCNAYVRRLIHQESKMRWPQKVRLEAKTDGGIQTLIVYKMGTKEEEKQKEAARRDKEKQEIKEAVGLTALLRKIADSGKLIVGHNMLLDLCHMIHQFFGPLPESYREFKSLIHGLFPRLLDTKVICQSPQFKDKVPSSILEAILDTVGKSPFAIPEIEPVEGRSYSLVSEKYHEAGYDAFITGLCFIALINNLGLSQQPEVSTVLPDSPLLNPFLNKLLITRLKDFPYINLEGNDPKPSRDHVFHLTFPKEWKLSDLSQLFSPFGGVYVSWLSDITAYVGLNRRDQSASLLKNLNKDKRMQKCKIQTYAEHQNYLDGNSAPITLDRKRKSPTEHQEQALKSFARDSVVDKSLKLSLEYKQKENSNKFACQMDTSDFERFRFSLFFF
ncbi:poly(A)-specific ribonuclease PARN-like isoform X2 [Venturia canescens]|uniref:poly(A)-specific ribonuclease PARN-like isoform X2 n=1 Tax=Venturia canescens TaxID=32260 RepID=UPI001C9C52F3|nr:poly(A)-specific ribonuclease PARN-like isoform X2 [Venturia canescens]